MMQFRLHNAPSTISRLMDLTLSRIAWEICLAYLDNITVLAKDWEEYLQ